MHLKFDNDPVIFCNYYCTKLKFLINLPNALANFKYVKDFFLKFEYVFLYFLVQSKFELGIQTRIIGKRMRGELGDKIERKKRQKSNMDRRKRDKGMNISIDKEIMFQIIGEDFSRS